MAEAASAVSTTAASSPKAAVVCLLIVWFGSTLFSFFSFNYAIYSFDRHYNYNDKLYTLFDHNRVDQRH